MGLSFSCFSSLHAQPNLIPNWSFEELDSIPLPGSTNLIRFGSLGDTFISHWYNPLTLPSSPISRVHRPQDFVIERSKPSYHPLHLSNYLYFTTKIFGSISQDSAISSDFQYGFSQVKLKEELNENCPYKFSTYVRSIGLSGNDLFLQLDPYGNFFSSKMITCDHFGFYFSMGPIIDSITINGSDIFDRGIQPQIILGRFLTDTSKYHLIQGNIMAAGGEQFLTIGLFEPVQNKLFYHFRDSSVKRMPDSLLPYFELEYYIDSLSLTALPADSSELVIIGDTTFCQGDSLRVEAQMSGGRQWQWRDGPRSPVRYLSQPGTYYLEALDPCGYRHRDSITLRYPETLGALPGGDTSLCAGEQVIFNLDPELHYRLNGQVVSGQLALTAPAQYRWEISNGCDTLRQNWHYAQKQVPALPPPGLVPDTSLCPPNIWVLPLPDSAYQYRLDGQRRSLPIAVNQPGNYRLSVSQACDSAEYAFRVDQESCAPELFIAKAFSPNGDGLNDRFSLKGEQPDEFEIRIFNRWGQQVFYSRDFSESWEGRYRDEAVSGTFQYKVYYQLRGYEIFRTGVVRVLR